MDIPRPLFIKYDQIYEKAEEFLRNYHPSRSLPVPIEKIIDLQMGIIIEPHFMLEKDHGLTGFISNDLTAIVVDEYVYDYQEPRFRFTLAHEIGHLILHGDIYRTFSACTPSEWNEIQLRLKDKERKAYEWQANCFAGLILVPREELKYYVSESVRKIDENGISLRNNWDYAWSCLADNLGREVFGVSAETIESRFYYDNIKTVYE